MTPVLRAAPLLVILAIAAAGCARDRDTEKRQALQRATEFAAKNDLPNAIIEYRRAIQIDPQLGEARDKLAQAYLESGDARNALAQIVRAADLLPDDLDVQLRAGNLLLAAGQFEDASARAERILSKDPVHAAAHVLKGNALAGMKNLDGALEELQQAAAADPQNALIQANVGLIHVAQGAQKEAEAAFLKGIEISPGLVLPRVAYGNYLLALNRLEAAERVLKEAFALDSADGLVNRALALFYVRTGRHAEAEPHLKRLADTSGEPETRFSLARFYLVTGRKEDGLRELRKLAAEKSTASEAKLEIAAIDYEDGRRTEGHRLLNEVLKSNATHPRAMLLKSRFLLTERKPEEALAAARAAAAGDPRLVGAHLVLGDAYTQVGDLEEAKKAFSEVLRLAPLSLRAQLALSRLHLMTGNSDLARQFATRAVNAAPTLPAARTAAIRASLASGNLTQAETEVSAFLKEHPNSVDGRLLEGTLRLLQKDYAAAERAFGRAATIDPASVTAANGQIQVLLATGRREAAKTTVNGLVTRNPQNADFLILSGRTHATLRDFATAEQALRQALVVDQNKTEAYNMLGQLYLLDGRLDSALQEFRTLAERRPKAVTAQTMVATILQVQNRRDEAREAFRKVLALDPGAAVAANNLAWMLAEDNSLDEALQLAQSAKSRLPESAAVADTLGWILYKRGLFARAVAELEQAVSMQPGHASYQYHLGLAYAKNGNGPQARKALESALKTQPAAPEAAEARAVLEELAVVGL